MEIATHPFRQARMELKTTSEMKEMLGRAAALDGLDLTSFVLGPAIEKARKVLSEHANIALAKQGQLALVELIQTQREPTQAMQGLMSLPDLPTRGSV